VIGVDALKARFQKEQTNLKLQLAAMKTTETNLIARVGGTVSPIEQEAESESGLESQRVETAMSKTTWIDSKAQRGHHKSTHSSQVKPVLHSTPTTPTTPVSKPTSGNPSDKSKPGRTSIVDGKPCVGLPSMCRRKRFQGVQGKVSVESPKLGDVHGSSQAQNGDNLDTHSKANKAALNNVKRQADEEAANEAAFHARIKAAADTDAKNTDPPVVLKKKAATVPAPAAPLKPALKPARKEAAKVATSQAFQTQKDASVANEPDTAAPTAVSSHAAMLYAFGAEEARLAKSDSPAVASIMNIHMLSKLAREAKAASRSLIGPTTVRKFLIQFKLHTHRFMLIMNHLPAHVKERSIKRSEKDRVCFLTNHTGDVTNGCHNGYAVSQETTPRSLKLAPMKANKKTSAAIERQAGIIKAVPLFGEKATKAETHQKVSHTQSMMPVSKNGDGKVHRSPPKAVVTSEKDLKKAADKALRTEIKIKGRMKEKRKKSQMTGIQKCKDKCTGPMCMMKCMDVMMELKKKKSAEMNQKTAEVKQKINS